MLPFRDQDVYWTWSHHCPLLVSGRMTWMDRFSFVVTVKYVEVTHELFSFIDTTESILPSPLLFPRMFQRHNVIGRRAWYCRAHRRVDWFHAHCSLRPFFMAKSSETRSRVYIPGTLRKYFAAECSSGQRLWRSKTQTHADTRKVKAPVFLLSDCDFFWTVDLCHSFSYIISCCSCLHRSLCATGQLVGYLSNNWRTNRWK